MITTVLRLYKDCATTPARFRYYNATIDQDCNTINADSTATHHDVSRHFYDYPRLFKNYHDITCRAHKMDCILSHTANSDLYYWTNLTIKEAYRTSLNSGTSSSLSSLISCSYWPYRGLLTILKAMALPKIFSSLFG